MEIEYTIKYKPKMYIKIQNYEVTYVTCFLMLSFNSLMLSKLHLSLLFSLLLSRRRS